MTCVKGPWTLWNVRHNAPVSTLTCPLTLARDEGLPKGFLQRAVPVQEPVAGRDGHVGGAINGLGGGCVGAQLFSCDLSINLTRGRVVSVLSPHSGLPCSPAHIPCSHPSSIPGSGRHVGAWDGPRQGQTGEREEGRSSSFRRLPQGPPPGLLGGPHQRMSEHAQKEAFPSFWLLCPRINNCQCYLSWERRYTFLQDLCDEYRHLLF